MANRQKAAAAAERAAISDESSVSDDDDSPREQGDHGNSEQQQQQVQEAEAVSTTAGKKTTMEKAAAPESSSALAIIPPPQEQKSSVKAAKKKSAPAPPSNIPGNLGGPIKPNQQQRSTTPAAPTGPGSSLSLVTSTEFSSSNEVGRGRHMAPSPRAGQSPRERSPQGNKKAKRDPSLPSFREKHLMEVTKSHSEDVGPEPMAEVELPDPVEYSDPATGFQHLQTMLLAVTGTLHGEMKKHNETIEKLTGSVANLDQSGRGLEEKLQRYETSMENRLQIMQAGTEEKITMAKTAMQGQLLDCLRPTDGLIDRNNEITRRMDQAMNSKIINTTGWHESTSGSQRRAHIDRWISEHYTGHYNDVDCKPMEMYSPINIHGHIGIGLQVIMRSSGARGIFVQQAAEHPIVEPVGRQKTLKINKQSTYRRKTIDEELYDTRDQTPGAVVKGTTVMVENRSIAWFEKDTQEIRKDDTGIGHGQDEHDNLADQGKGSGDQGQPSQSPQGKGGRGNGKKGWNAPGGRGQQGGKGAEKGKGPSSWNQDDQQPQEKGKKEGGGKKGGGKGKNGKEKGKGGNAGGQQQFMGQCNNCGEYGHKATECPNPPQSGKKGKKGTAWAPIGSSSSSSSTFSMNGNAPSSQMPSLEQMQQQLHHLQQVEQQQQHQQNQQSSGQWNGGSW